MFDYENWKVYKLAVEMREIAEELRRTAPEGLANDIDHAVRTAASSVSNLGEGGTRRTKKAKVNFYDISRGAGGEYNAILKSIRGIHPNTKLIDRGCEVSSQFSVLMLNLIKKVERREKIAGAASLTPHHPIAPSPDHPTAPGRATPTPRTIC
jgi:four helix bundle protein